MKIIKLQTDASKKGGRPNKSVRCTRTKELEVHHIDRTDGNDLSNARVLCQKCHEVTDTYGEAGPQPPDFEQATKEQALERAKHLCECNSTRGCH